MPVPKNRRTKRVMKKRTFWTKKAARRYVKRFMWQFMANHRSKRPLALTMASAFDKLHK